MISFTILPNSKVNTQLQLKQPAVGIGLMIFLSITILLFLLPHAKPACRQVLLKLLHMSTLKLIEWMEILWILHKHRAIF